MDLEEFRRGLDDWLDRNAAELEPDHAASSLDAQVAHLAKVKRLAYDAGWMRWGWPERVGGLGGSTLLRAYLGEALTARDLVEPGIYSMTETLAPTMVDYAPPELAAQMIPRLLRGTETWCQGFSEPGTGSNLAALSCRARRDGEVWRVTGQKVWTSLAQYAQRCVLLVRTGAPDSSHRGITALFVDMDDPGISVRPIETMHGAPEFCEVFFDDVAVPTIRTLGKEGEGWSVAMDLLPYERSTALWHRAAHLHQRLQHLLEVAPAEKLDPAEVGATVQLLTAFRARSRATQHRLAGGERLGPETSIDKVLVAEAEQAVFDLAAAVLAQPILFGDDPESARWRSEFLFSRAATIYGGSSEIQRNIIARRLLDLGDDR
ncbi:MAG TPA: acyl-CoA dehydrogenase family protein [Acidimicrobiales bacterium]|nr:acyl-CoA dehydrogenase family protein [Acidimicrobiales bacterium]